MANQPRDSKGRWTKGGAGVAAVLTAGVVAAGSVGSSAGAGSSVAGQTLKVRHPATRPRAKGRVTKPGSAWDSRPPRSSSSAN
jgi:hypothetical protein